MRTAQTTPKCQRTRLNVSGIFQSRSELMKTPQNASEYLWTSDNFLTEENVAERHKTYQNVRECLRAFSNAL